jgi:CheY-like chemotaxis protein
MLPQALPATLGAWWRGGPTSTFGASRVSDEALGCHVLVVDDDPLVRAIAVKLLGAIGCVASVLASGEGVAAEIDRAARIGQPIDLVLMDLQLGATSGLDACRSLRAAGIDVAVVLMSGDDVDSHVDEEIDGTLRKPFSLPELRECVAWYGRLGRPPS